LSPGGGNRDVEVARSDLASTLAGAAMARSEFLFGDSIAALHETSEGVEVTFESGRERRFDLVVGADGQHSCVRRLVFGGDERFVRFLGLYVATVVLDGPSEDPRRVLLHNVPGRSVSVHPAGGTPIAAFIFRSAAIPGFDHRDREQHKRRLAEAYAGVGWRTPELLARVRETDELYFDAVSQVRLSRWSRGRVVLLGDAASSVSLFGEGSSLAITGARTLADALADLPGDHAAALARYESVHRQRVRPRQRGVGAVSRVLVPGSRAGLAVRDTTARLWSRLGSAPAAAAPTSTGAAGRGPR
jgi:2-polyprenyl-6-methoxyphenol hydroxylase-like FAD-dependent oxidoreductase